MMGHYDTNPFNDKPKKQTYIVKPTISLSQGIINIKQFKNDCNYPIIEELSS